MQRFDDTDFSLNTMLRCIVPGWAHRYRGNVVRGRLFLVAYLGFLIPALLLFGTSLGSALLGLAFAMHVAGASDALVGRFASIGDRLTFAAACALALGAGIYVPIGLGVSQFAVPIYVSRPVSIFAQDDVLWYNPKAQIESGDYVLYTVPDTTLSGANNHTRYVLQNQTIGRTAAVAGQRVRVKNGKMYVDDVRVPELPPIQVASMLQGGFVVPDGAVFIPGNGFIPTEARLTMSDWQRLCLIPRSSIAGRVFFRSHPLWRISAIRGIVSGIE